MVEKIWYCPKCKYIPQNIPYEKQPRTCPKCGLSCKEGDFVNSEDFKAIIEDYRLEGRVLKSFKSDETEKND